MYLWRTSGQVLHLSIYANWEARCLHKYLVAEWRPEMERTKMSNQYPVEPGFKVSGASEKAAQFVKENNLIRKSALIVMAILEQTTASADELSHLLPFSRLYISPRLSEMRSIGLLQEAGDTKGDSGRTMTRWRVLPEAEEFLLEGFESCSTDADMIALIESVIREFKADYEREQEVQAKGLAQFLAEQQS
jgi:hypothetical protein